MAYPDASPSNLAQSETMSGRIRNDVRPACHPEKVSESEARKPRAAAKRGADRGEVRDGVTLTNLDQPLFPDAGATKRDLIDYLDAVSDRLLPELRDRPLSVVRVLRGQQPFMQKNLPRYAPDWIRTVTQWAESSRREISYALCDDRRTLLWFGNQRAVEYHPTLARAQRGDQPTYLVLDLDPPEPPASPDQPEPPASPDPPPAEPGMAGPGSAGFTLAVRAAMLVREVLAEAGLSGAVKTSGAKGVHIFVPLAPEVTAEPAAAAARALAARVEAADPSLATTAFIREDREGKVFIDSTRSGGATVVAAYSPRLRPGLPVSFPVSWPDLERVVPADFPMSRVPDLLGDDDPWARLMPSPQTLPADLVAQGREIPIARVAAMHEGKRRKRAAQASPTHLPEELA